MAIVALCAVILFIAILALPPAPATVPQTVQQMPSPTPTPAPFQDMFFLPENSRITDILPGGSVRVYSFYVKNHEVIKFIRVLVSGRSDLNVIVGKDSVPPVPSAQYDPTGYYTLVPKEITITNPALGTYFLAVQNNWYSNTTQY